MLGSTTRKPRYGRLGSALLRTQPDRRLAALARGGGNGAFEEIVRRHRPALVAYAGAFAPPSRADDVVQESLLKAYTALQDGAEPELLRAWLFRIVRNTAIDEQRGVRHHEQLDENYDGVEQPPQALARREEIAALVLAIKDLPPSQREAIVQRELEGRGHEEIGRDLNLSPGAVRQLIYRARYSLREAAGAVIPAALVRAASMPGAGETVGGLGMAGAVKVGLATVLATGTIVAGTTIERDDGGGTAQAVDFPSSGRAATTGDTSGDSAGDSAAVDDRRGRERSRDGSSDDRASRTGEPGEHSSSGSGSSGSGGGGDDSSHEGPGGGGSPNSGPGGGGSNSGPGGGSDDPLNSGSGSSGSGVSGDGVSGGGGTSGSGSDDGASLLLDASGSSSGPH